MPDIALVCMPYAPLERPSIAIGELIASGKRSGVSVASYFPTFEFAARIGLRPYYALTEGGDVSDLIGEWTFSRSAFPDNPDWGDDSAFLARVLDSYHFNLDAFLWYFDAESPEGIQEALRAIRSKATEFVYDTAELVLATNPRIVGCSSAFQQHCASLALLREIKRRAPDIVTMLGGPNCEAEMGVATAESFEWIDYVVSGEADQLFGPFCRALLTQSQDAVLSLPTGVIRGGSQFVRDVPPPRATARDLDSSPVPDYDDYFAALRGFKDRELLSPGLLIETSRGCWYGAAHHCTFCGLNGTSLSFDSKSAARVLAEMDFLAERYRISSFEVVDNILDMKYFRSVLPRMKELACSPMLFYETKANLNEWHVRSLAEAGVRWIQPGIESLHDELLSLINKGCSTLGNVALLKYAIEQGIRLSWNLLFGIPRETSAPYFAMLRYMPALFHLQPPGHLVPIRFDRFSPYHARQSDFGLELVPNRAYRHVYPVESDILQRLAYFFENDKQLQLAESGTYFPALKEQFLQWNAVFYDECKKSGVALEMTECADATVIRDRRPIAAAGTHILTGLAHHIYAACRAPVAVREIIERHVHVSTSSEVNDILQLIEELKQKHLVLQINDRLLALAARTPRQKLPLYSEFPGGYVNLAKARDREQQRVNREPVMV